MLITGLDLLLTEYGWTSKAIRDMHTLFSSKERAYWEAKVAAAASNSKKRWQILNKLMSKDVKSQIPDSATAEAFSKFFSHKVESVQSATENAAPPSFSPCPTPCCFDTFQPLTPEQVLILIKRAPDKTSDLDRVPNIIFSFRRSRFFLTKTFTIWKNITFCQGVHSKQARQNECSLITQICAQNNHA